MTEIKFFFVVVVALLVGAAGCSQATSNNPDGDGDSDGDVDGDSDGDADGDGDSDLDPWCSFAELTRPAYNQVDLLLVVDNSATMAEEQAVLADQLEVMLRELVSPASPDSPVVDDLHIGVVSTNMGVGGYRIATCWGDADGDNGELQQTSRADGCERTYIAPDCTTGSCGWLTHSPDFPDDGSDPENPPIWVDTGCVSTLGTWGCGFEQPLEASLAALTTQTEPGGTNEGFLRDDSILMVIYVTDEDDCSAADSSFFDPAADELGPLNIRCALNPDMLHPVSRYHDAFLALRPGREDLVTMAAISGVPIDGSWNPGDPLERLRDLQQVNPAEPNNLLPVCETAMGSAFPPVRIVELAYMFGVNGVLESICREDWTSALMAITGVIQRRLTSSCLGYELELEDAAQCRLIETLSDDRECPNLANGVGSTRTEGWQADLGLSGDGRRRCQVMRTDYNADGCPDGDCACSGDDYRGCLQGWFYRPDSPPCALGRVELTSREIISDDSTVSFECRSPSCGD